MRGTTLIESAPAISFCRSYVNAINRRSVCDKRLKSPVAFANRPTTGFLRSPYSYLH